jgi:glycosyltransferase involved in cell wall biosynthesis
MKIYVCPADMQGCGYYRSIWPAKELIKQGHNIEIVWPAQRDTFLKGEVDPRTKKIVGVKVPSDADVIVLQRVTNNYLAQAIPFITAKGVAVVIDMDDDLSSIHPDNPAFGYLRPGRDREHTWENARQACMDATMVSVSTPALLKRYAPHGRGTVLYNMIPGPFLTIPHVDSAVVGWGGSAHSHPNDIPLLGTPVSQWLQDGIKFTTVGPPDGIISRLGLHKDAPIDSTGSIPINRYPLELTNIGIGVAPLADTGFNAAKSWLKPLEYAAVGVPCVASPRAEYTRLNKLGVGLLAKNSREWYTTVKFLVDNPTARAELAEKGRRVVSELTVERQAWRWLEVWTSAAAQVNKNPLKRSAHV